MPVPFRDVEELQGLGAAGFLRCLGVSGGHVGALLLIDARGDPLELVHARIETPRSFLWRRSDIHRRAGHDLIVALFSHVQRSPDVILFRADEVPSHVFADDIAVEIPVCQMLADSAEWNAIGEPPTSEGPAARLLSELERRGLILEPFGRVRDALVRLYDVDAAVQPE